MSERTPVDKTFPVEAGSIIPPEVRDYRPNATRFAPAIIEVLGLATGEPFAETQFVFSFDPDADNGRGNLVLTPSPREALSFPNARAALEFWRQTSTVRPVRDDGKPNRPLTAYTVSIVTAEAKR